MRRLFLGVDPGKSGYFAFITKDLKEAELYPWPSSLEDLIDIFEQYLEEDDIVYAAVEIQQAVGGQKPSTLATQMENFGMWQGALASMRIDYERVSPQKWQYKTLEGLKIGDDTKVVSLDFARRKFPYLNFGNNHNKSDAVNIALYARKLYLEV